MSNGEEKGASDNTRMLVLALGLVIGFVFAFIMMLSRLPTDTAIEDPLLSLSEESQQNFQFYDLLKQQSGQGSVVEDVTAERRVITPGTRPVPGNALAINQRTLAAEAYAEIPASSIGQESYYLQAGNFVEPADAERARAAVNMLGLDAFVVKRQINGRIGHRVRVGPFFDQQRLTDAKQRLRRGNIQYEIIRVAGFRSAGQDTAASADETP